MTTDLKRFTISITSCMQAELDAVKKVRYCKKTQSEMIRDLIVRGLAALEEEKETEKVV